MTSKQLKQQVIISQFLLVLLSLILSLFLFESFTDWQQIFNWNLVQFVQYGVFTGFIIVAIDLLLMNFLPESYYDDGGINKKVFKNRTITEILFITIIVAISEEMLFRGVLQTTFGYFFASIVFAIVHIRYLFKPVLLISVLLVSFYLGYIFEITNNLIVTIIAHFTIDFLLALVIRFQK